MKALTENFKFIPKLQKLNLCNNYSPTKLLGNNSITKDKVCLLAEGLNFLPNLTSFTLCNKLNIEY